MLDSRHSGAACIVAGTAIGAGMLGLPMVIGPMGFLPGTLLMAVVWAMALFSALLLLEVNLKIGAGKNFNNMAREVLGRGGQIVATGSMAFLLYALLVAYLTGVGGLVARTGGALGMAVTPQAGSLLFAVAGGVVVLIGTALVVRVNKALFYGMLVAMVVAFASLVPGVDVANLTTAAPREKLVLACLPVLFTSFGFHTGIPSIVRFLRSDARSLRRVILVGTALPVICYFLWLMVSLGGMPAADISRMGGNVDTLVSALAGSSAWLGSVLSAFAALALITSFLGVALALFDLLAETFRLSDSVLHRTVTAVLVFAPPVTAALLSPGRFIQALAHAGAALTILAVFLPCAMAWKLRRDKVQASYQVAGGTAALVVTSAFGLLVVSASYL
ncbi:amino acid permease [Oleidesulfovibrio alaskensis]|uniref:amino acid permease n=1 Tax=Oleidesulfovibrio alaskensis TaxID=58180 RepID=UPI00054D0C46|nr:aromatic amino acid transport family protein [Oleidesulfovibrio alaskensis]